MATASVEICNLALVRVGVKNTIETLEEDSVEAEVCNVTYGQMRDVALASWWWSFATGRADLAQLEDEERDGWGYAYSLPSDLIQPRFIYTGTRFSTPATEVPYLIESNAAGSASILFADHDAPSLIYTRRILTVPAYPPLFVNALSWLMAANLIVPLKLRPELEPYAVDRYEKEISKARAADWNARHETPQMSTYQRVRG